MEPNAWDRAQRAIDRAERRDATVVTPDNAVSPFDSAATMILPVPPEGAVTHRFAAHTTPASRPARRPRRGGPAAPEEPPTTPVEVSDPGLAILTDEPSADADADGRAPAGRPPDTAPFPDAADAADASAAGDEPDTAGRSGAGRVARRPWWRRLFRRR